MKTKESKKHQAKMVSEHLNIINLMEDVLEQLDKKYGQTSIYVVCDDGRIINADFLKQAMFVKIKGWIPVHYEALNNLLSR